MIDIFKFEQTEVRTLVIDNVPYFVAKNIAEILGYSDTQAMTRRLDDDEINTCTDNSSGQDRAISIINESGLYNAILGSKKPEAKAFKKWVTSEVLPTIRKKGIYATHEALEWILANPESGISLLEELKAEREKSKQAEDIVQRLMHSEKTYNTTELAKELGLSSANVLNEILRKHKIIYKLNGTWLPYHPFSVNGFFEVKQKILPNGYLSYQSSWTQKGRAFLLEFWEKLKKKQSGN